MKCWGSNSQWWDIIISVNYFDRIEFRRKVVNPHNFFSKQYLWKCSDLIERIWTTHCLTAFFWIMVCVSNVVHKIYTIILLLILNKVWNSLLNADPDTTLPHEQINFLTCQREKKFPNLHINLSLSPSSYLIKLLI